MSTLYYESSISHHGIKGQKWGVRRYQNPDGTLTKAGERRRDYYDKKYRHGSSHAITGLVYEQHGMQKLADIYYKKADKQTEGWKKKRDELDTYTSDKHVNSTITEYTKSMSERSQQLPYGSQLPDNATTRKASDYLWKMRSELYTSGRKIPKHDFDDLNKQLLDIDTDTEILRNVHWANQMQKDAKDWLDKSKSSKISEIDDWYKHHGPGPEEAPKSRDEKNREVKYWDEGSYDQYNTATKFLDQHGGYDKLVNRLTTSIDDGIYLAKITASKAGLKEPTTEQAESKWKEIDRNQKR